MLKIEPTIVRMFKTKEEKPDDRPDSMNVKRDGKNLLVSPSGHWSPTLPKGDEGNVWVRESVAVFVEGDPVARVEPEMWSPPYRYASVDGMLEREKRISMLERRLRDLLDQRDMLASHIEDLQRMVSAERS